MIKTDNKRFKSSNTINDIFVKIWYPDCEKYDTPVCILQICHGMIDHIERFDDMARYMAERGILVVGNDHIGHGHSVTDEDNYGYFADDKDPGKYLVEDMHRLTRIMKKKYPDIPYFLAGHSMGSFMVRRYIIKHGEELDGAVIMGTGNQPHILVSAGLALSNITDRLKGDRYRSSLINKIMFGAYNKKYDNARTEHDWLTTDESVVDAYENDKMCSYIFTVNGYYGLLNTIAYVSNKKNIKKAPVDLPVLMVSGKDDPVGGYGKDVEKLYDIYKKHFEDVTCKIYTGCRHELHSELQKDYIFEDIYKWVEQRV